MKLGTPLYPGAIRAMLLGCGELAKEVAIALQRFGVEVIGVHGYANAPGQQVAHRACVIDMTDGIALRRLVEQERPHIIVPETEAIATDTLAAIEAEGLARVIPNARAVELTMNREGIRRLAAEELGLPTSRYAFAESLEQLHAGVTDIGLPCIVKPVMSSSGKGQSVLYRRGDVEPAWDKAVSGGQVRQSRVIVEEMIEFDYEITLLTVRARGDCGEPETLFCAPVGHRQVQGDYVESWQPHPMAPGAWQRAREIAGVITENLGGYGVFGVELFVKGDRVWFSEVSPRPHDTGMVTMSSQLQNEFELHTRAILGLPVSTRLLATAASTVIYGGLDARGIGFAGVAAALAVPNSDLRLFGKPESFLRRRMGVALACAETLEEARSRAREAAARVRPVA
jgi:phosphoribosylglycinamide formyltransferase 2